MLGGDEYRDSNNKKREHSGISDYMVRAPNKNSMVLKHLNRKGCDFMERKLILDIEAENGDPKTGRILCIGTLDVSRYKIIVFTDEIEKYMIERFVRYFKYHKFDEIIGYNLPYDMRYIFAKCLKYGIESGILFKAKETDLMRIMKSVNGTPSFNRPGKLGEWAEYLFGMGKLKKTCSVKQLFDERRFAEMVDYNKQDLKLTYMLWKRTELVLNGNKV